MEIIGYANIIENGTTDIYIHCIKPDFCFSQQFYQKMLSAPENPLKLESVKGKLCSFP